MARKKRFQPFEIESVSIIDAATDGRGVASFEGKKIFVEFAVPEDEVALRVFDKDKKLFLGSINELISPSKFRISPKCKHFGLCGGCKWQMMDYQAQLFFKTKQISDIFQRIGKIEFPTVKPAIPSPEIYYYRNKLEFSFGQKAWVAFDDRKTENTDRPVLGFHGRGSFEKILNIEECHLQVPILTDILNELRDFAIEKEIPFYHQREQTGFLRQLMFRSSVATGELMATLVVKEENKEWIDLILGFLAERFPQISDFLYVINAKLNSSFTDLPFHVWKGKAYITESLGNYQFRISPTSFFQTNPRQAQNLYGVAKEMLRQVLPEGKEKHELIYDLYTGTGSIAIFVSDLAEKVVGVEYVESSIIDAGANCALNNLHHLSFFAGDMKKVLNDDFIAQNGKPSVIITDPPRAGMDKGVVDQILKILPTHLIYISCHPATQARDAEMLYEHYEIKEIQPVDMFPHTAHIENVMLMQKREVPLVREIIEPAIVDSED